LHSLKQHLSEILAKVRQTLATKVTQDNDGSLAELQAMLIMPTIEKVKGVLQDLSVCISIHFLIQFFKFFIYLFFISYNNSKCSTE